MISNLVPSLIEIQNRYGYLPHEELEFLALRARVPLYRVQEVTSFFPHFRREKPPKVVVHICQSMTCHLRGAPELLKKAHQAAAGNKEIEVHGVSCLGRCDRAPVCFLSQHSPVKNGDGHGEQLFCNLDQQGGHDLLGLIRAASNDGHLKEDTDKHNKLCPEWATKSPGWKIDPYVPGRGEPQGDLEPYAAVKKFLADEKTTNRLEVRDKVIAEVKYAGLMGMGGAAASTFRKWDEVRNTGGGDYSAQRYVICNADESEPGTFKDRELMLRTPHLLIEGMLIAGLTVGASHGFIYTRHEYPEQIKACDDEIKRAEGIVPEATGRVKLKTFTSPGLYICGEESALIEVIEGKRAQPRNQPPTIKENGLADKPTVVNNVETYSWVPAILMRQPRNWYRDNPLRFFSISGDVKKPGVFEVPFSMSLGELIELAGGMADGLDLYAAAMSGPSGGFVPATFTKEQSASLIAKIDRAVNLADTKPDARHDMGGYDPSSSVYRWRQGLKPAQVEQVNLRDLPLNVQAYRAMGLSLGAAVVMYGARKGDEPQAKKAMLERTVNVLEFFEKESCGKCVPCRLGAQQLKHFSKELSDARMTLPMVEPTVRTLAGVMKVASICGLGRAASVPFVNWLDYFK